MAPKPTPCSIAMAELSALQKLLVWLSPAFPVGAFAWSAGLETVIAQGAMTDSASTRNWIEGALAHGGLRTDAVLLALAHRAHADTAALRDLADLAAALTPASERLAEIETTGEAFTAAARAWPSDVYARLLQPCPYAIAVGAIAAAHHIDRLETLTAFLTAAVHGQISVAVRLIPLGQTDGLKIMAGLEPLIETVAIAATKATLADLGSIAYAADIAQMRHETLETRIFRS